MPKTYVMEYIEIIKNNFPVENCCIDIDNFDNNDMSVKIKYQGSELWALKDFNNKVYSDLPGEELLSRLIYILMKKKTEELNRHITNLFG